MAKLEKIEGIGPKYAASLRQAGVKSTNDLLDMGATRNGRNKIAKDSGLKAKQILEWVNHVDLFRLKGVGEEYADLLEEAGIDTVVELSNRNPENLHKELRRTNEEKRLVRQLPNLMRIREWVKEAKKMPRRIEY